MDYYSKGKNLFLKNRLNQAQEMFLKALKQDYDNIDYLFAVAYAYHSLNNIEEGSKYYDKVLEQDENHIKALLGKIAILESKNPYKALSKIEYLTKKIPDEGIFWAKKGSILLNHDIEKNKAGECFQKAILSSSDMGYVYFKCSEACLTEFNLEKSKKYLNKTLELTDKNKSLLDSDTFVSHYNVLNSMMDVQIKLGEFEDALDSCENLLQINRQDTKILHHKAYILYKIGDIEASKSVISFGLHYEPENSDLLNLKAVIHELEGPVSAERSYQKSVEIDDNEVALSNLSGNYYDSGKYHKAIEYAQKSLKINPNNGIALHYGYLAAKKLNRDELAENYIKRWPKSDIIIYERTLRKKLAKEPNRFKVAGFELELIKEEFALKDRRRIDLLFEDKNNGDLVVVELKVVKATKKTYYQISEYINSLKTNTIGKYKNVKGIVVSNGQDEEFKKLISSIDIVQIDIKHLGLEMP